MRNWPPLVAALAVIVYATATLGFGLNFRPLHHDEGVTLDVASQPSADDVLRVAIDVRHGPPLHYLIVHASLAWRDDILGLRLPSALLGMLAVALCYGAGRELLGRCGGAVMTVIVAASPIMVHLGQFARGYTAMIAAAFGSLWLLMVLLRTRQARWIAPYAVVALLLVSAHPFGLFALASELALLVILGLLPLVGDRRRGIGGWRPAVTLLATLALGSAALLLLRSAYAPLQDKYGVGQGGPVVDLTSTAFWDRLGGHALGTDRAGSAALLGLAVVAGIGMLWISNRRAAIVVTVWMVLPLVALQALTASSSDFAPERHLSFLMPGFAAALAGLVVELVRRMRRRWKLVPVLIGAAILAPGLVAAADELRHFSTGLHDASLMLDADFGDRDVFLTTAGTAEPGEEARLYGAYAVLSAPSSSPLASWRVIGGASDHCVLVRELQQQPAPTRVWLLARPFDADRLAAGLRAVGAEATVYGAFVLASADVPRSTPRNALMVGARLWKSAVAVEPGVADFRRIAQRYRTALRLNRERACAPH